MTYPWEEIGALSTAALVLTGISAIVFAYLQLRQDRDATRIENLEKQTAYFDSDPFVRIRTSLAQQRTSEETLKSLRDDDAPSELYDVLNFFEHLAFLVRRRHLTAYDVWHTFGYWAFHIYYDARRVIEYEQSDDGSFYDDFCWLISILQKIEKRRCGKMCIPSDEDILGFYLDERKSPPKLARRRARKRPLRSTGPKGGPAGLQMGTSA